MRTIARLCLTYCTAFPLQRYGMIGGLTLALAGVAFMGVAPAAAVLVTTFGVVVLVAACLVPVGWVFREISTPRAHRFAPHSRTKLLAALLVVVMAPSVLAGTVAVSAPGEAALLAALVYPALITSGMIWFFFFLPASTLVPVPFVLALTITSRTDAEALDAFLAGAGLLVGAVVLVAGWSAFAAWYLGAARIGPFRSRLLSKLNGASGSSTPLPGAVPFRTALRAHLWRFRPRAPLFATIAGAGAVALLLAYVVGPEGMPMMQAPILGVMLLAFHPGREATYRARLLWLRSRLSRDQLFACAEAGLPSQWASWGLPLVIGLACAFALRGMALAALLPFFAMAASTAALGGYLGLMALRPAGVLDVSSRVAYVASVAYGAWILLDAFGGAGTDGGSLLWIAGAQAAAALVCRSIAKRRWQGIDWLETKPPRRDSMQGMAELMQGER